MKKIVAVCWILAFSGVLAFSQGYFQLGAGIAYHAYPDASEMDAFALRAGMTVDFLFPTGGSEIGVELGFYVLPMDILVVDFLFLDIPVDLLFRANFTPDRSLAFELRGGMWLRNYTVSGFGESVTVSDTTYHAGGRFVLGSVYIGADYIAPSKVFPSVIVVEAGLKASFGGRTH